MMAGITKTVCLDVEGLLRGRRAVETCPFKVGDVVIYKPSFEGRGKVIMTDLADPKPGEQYKVTRIDKGVYVTVEGFEGSVPNGLYWTEFTPADSE
jgi:hypothetical protein